MGLESDGAARSGGAGHCTEVAGHKGGAAVTTRCKISLWGLHPVSPGLLLPTGPTQAGLHLADKHITGPTQGS